MQFLTAGGGYSTAARSSGERPISELLGVKLQPWMGFRHVQRSLRRHNRFLTPAPAFPGRLRLLGRAEVGVLGGKAQSIAPLVSGRRNPTVPRCRIARPPFLRRPVLLRQLLVLCLRLAASPAILLAAAGISGRKFRSQHQEKSRPRSVSLYTEPERLLSPSGFIRSLLLQPER